jgi:NTE family protein
VKTAFVLSGGASLGAIQVGQLQALAEHGIRPDFLVGTSVGAINAAWVAGRPEPEALDELAGIWLGLTRERIFPFDPVTGARGLIGRANHLVSPVGLRQLLEEHIGFTELEDARIPVHVVATDLESGAEVLLSRGPAIRAIMASAAIPGVFPPVAIDGRQLVDGGIADHTPVAKAIHLGARRIYVLPTGYTCSATRLPRSAIGMFMHAVTLFMQERLADEVEHFREHAELHVAPPLCPLTVSPLDFRHAAELIERAHRETAEWLDAEPPTRHWWDLLRHHDQHRVSSSPHR